MSSQYEREEGEGLAGAHPSCEDALGGSLCLLAAPAEHRCERHVGALRAVDRLLCGRDVSDLYGVRDAACPISTG